MLVVVKESMHLICITILLSDNEKVHTTEILAFAPITRKKISLPSV